MKKCSVPGTGWLRGTQLGRQLRQPCTSPWGCPSASLTPRPKSLEGPCPASASSLLHSSGPVTSPGTSMRRDRANYNETDQFRSVWDKRTDQQMY